MKGVVGMISESKLPEPLEKEYLDPKTKYLHLKDGTIRHDSTDLPLTHFYTKKKLELLLKNFWKWVILKTAMEIQLKMMSRL